MTNRVYLSRRNILTLLSQLDDYDYGEDTVRTLNKYDNVHPKYPQTMDVCMVEATEQLESTNVNVEGHHVRISRSSLNVALDMITPTGPLASIDIGTIMVIEIHPVEDADYYTHRQPGPV